jgi:oligopeptide/dipeptide ABC transporter ATP-binding protein
MRVCATMFVSGTFCWAVVVPFLQMKGVIQAPGFAAIVQWTLWFGASCMVAAGLLSFALNWRMALSAFRDLGQVLSLRSVAPSEHNSIEAPMSWFAVGQIVSLVALAWLGHASFGMPIWQTVIAVALSFWLALVACRVTGETDTTPVGAMGKVTQLTFGALSPGNINVNLMSANITAGAATSAADLLTDLKSGYLLGANPRQQFLAQLSGIFVGTIVTVLTFAVLVPNAEVLGTDQFPAPAAQTWAAVAIALGQGLSSLDVLMHPSHPYTLAMLAATVHGQARGRDIEAIAGSPPDLRRPIVGCSFAPRCKYAIADCRQALPAPVAVNGDQYACCVRAGT